MATTKHYFIKVFKSNGNYVTTWNDAKFFSFRQTMNGGLGQIVIDIARPFDNFGEGNDVALNNEIQLWVSDGDSGSTGQKVYSGYISGYTAKIDGDAEGVRVFALGYVTKLTKSRIDPQTFTSKDVSQIVKEVADDYIDGTGLPSGVSRNAKISWNNTSIPASTGNTITYNVSLNNHFEIIDRLRQFAPENWWFFIGADNKLQFKQKNNGADHTFIFGKDFHKIEIFKNMENIVNDINFWNGLQSTDENFINNVYQDNDSMNDHSQSYFRKIDGRVTVSGTADTFGNALLAEKKDPETRILVEILDNNSQTDGYDIESIQVGHTVNFRGFNDVTSSVFTDRVQIAALTYMPDRAILEIDTKQANLSRATESISTKLDENIITDGPTTTT